PRARDELEHRTRGLLRETGRNASRDERRLLRLEDRHVVPDPLANDLLDRARETERREDAGVTLEAVNVVSNAPGAHDAAALLVVGRGGFAFPLVFFPFLPLSRFPKGALLTWWRERSAGPALEHEEADRDHGARDHVIRLAEVEVLVARLDLDEEVAQSCRW